jgi:drug/metabolite transporter superfamily protein YnfA
MAALAVLCFLRALREPTPGALTAFAVSGALALLTHYFAVFLLVPMCLWLVLEHRAHRRLTLAAVAAVGAVGVALLPLISAQGGRGTQWIGRWPLGERLEAIPQYYLTGESGAPLGHGVELLIALPVLGGLFFGLWRGLTRLEERQALIVLVLSACGVLIPVVLLVFGLDYLAPRNLVAAMIPLTALLALVIAAQRTGRVGAALAGVVALAFLAMSVDVNLSPRLQRGDWRGVAKVLRGTPANERVITTVELGAAPLEYYLPPLHNLARGGAVTVSEIDETGYAPLRASAGRPPAPGFHLSSRYDVNGLIVYRFLSRSPRKVSEAALRRHVITEAHPEVLVSEDQAPL